MHNVIPIDLGSRRQSRSNSNISITNRDLPGGRQLQHPDLANNGIESSHSAERDRGIITTAPSADRERRRRTSSVGSGDSGPKGAEHYDPYEAAVYGKLSPTTSLRCLADQVLLTPLIDVPNAR